MSDHARFDVRHHSDVIEVKGRRRRVPRPAACLDCKGINSENLLLDGENNLLRFGVVLRARPYVSAFGDVKGWVGNGGGSGGRGKEGVQAVCADYESGCGAHACGGSNVCTTNL
jgi:hypothetical protein